MSVGGPGVSIVYPIEEIVVNLENGGEVLTTGVSEAFYVVSFKGEILGWHLVANTEGILTVDILKAFESVPTEFDSIAGTEVPSLNNQQYNSDTVLSTWSETRLDPGDILGINVIAASGISQATITFKIQKY